MPFSSWLRFGDTSFGKSSFKLAIQNDTEKHCPGTVVTVEPKKYIQKLLVSWRSEDFPPVIHVKVTSQYTQKRKKGGKATSTLEVIPYHFLDCADTTGRVLSI
eukprot:765863-Hanusia_phi.AAC.4